MQPDQLAKKIRENLELQKNKLEEYLNILEAEESDLDNREADKLLNHIKIESNILDELAQFKKLLTPLETIYVNSPYKKDDTIFKLKKSIESLSCNVQEKSENNKLKLESVISKVKLSLKPFSKTKTSQSPYSNTVPGIVDISG